MKKTTCTKRYDNFPFSHRQPKHSGHCNTCHGHNWSFEFEFSCHAKDACGFVVDFGELKPLKSWLTEMFDHTQVFNEDDPMVEDIAFKTFTQKFSNNVKLVKDCSCEGIAQLALENGTRIVNALTGRRVTVSRVTVFEDSKNSATVYAK